MKTFLIISLLSLPNLFFSYADDQNQAHAEEVRDIYTCPMHPEVKSDHPGKCPICHMNLQKISSKPSNAAAGIVKNPAEKKIKFYRNPMDPSITSKVPAKDNMGMDYIPVYDTEGATSESMSDVPLRAAVTIDQVQFRLSGAALAKVERKSFSVEIPVAGRALSANRVALQVPERDISSLNTGLEVEVTAPATGGEILSGKISGIDSALDPMTRTLRVDVQLSRAYPTLRSEASVQGLIRKDIKDAIAVPRESVMQSGAISYVFIANQKESLLVPTKITLGERGATWIEVKGGLTEGQLISSGPNFLIDSESRIQTSYDQ